MIKKWLKAFLGLSILAVIGRLLGFFREMLIASNFGANEITDSYLTTLLIFDIAMAANASFLAGTLSFSSSLKNQNLYSPLAKLSIKVFIITLVSAVILFPIIKLIVPFIFVRSDASMSVITSSAQMFFILTAFLISSGILSAVLQMKGDIVNPGRLIIFLNFFSILFLFLFSKAWGIVSIPIGFLVGGIIFFVYQIYLINRVGLIPSTLNKNRDFKTPAWLSSIMLIFLNALLPSITGFVERYFSYFFAEGTFSHYIYAGKIILLSMTIVSLAISTSLLPFQTEAMQQNNMSEFQKATNKGILLTIHISAFFVIIFFLLTQPVVQIIFQRGNFSFNDTIETTLALRVLSLALIPFLIVPIINNIFYSYRNLKTSILINLITITLQATLLYIFSSVLSNIQSLVWASVITAWINLGLLLAYLITSRKLILEKESIKKIFIIISIMVFIMVAGSAFLNQFEVFEKTAQYNLLVLFIKLCVSIICLFLLFVGLSFVLLKESMKSIYLSFRNQKEKN
ncbi:MAG: hypothetical protein N3A61_08430 [Ignavibacteria bacterium]|nr:hypothetical protein [Ignavibacteria bacterium]